VGCAAKDGAVLWQPPGQEIGARRPDKGGVGRGGFDIVKRVVTVKRA
jgi:hypothetical protein